MPNVYVGQYANIQHSAVYASIDEAVKEVGRVIQTGLMIAFVNLPDSKEYWIAGTVGKNSNPKFNLIFTNKDKARAHCDNLKQRGWPSTEVLLKELKIVKDGPKNPDIKTEEHLNLERKYNLLKRSLQLGLPITNDEGNMEIMVIEDDPGRTDLVYNRGTFAIFRLDTWTEADPVVMFERHRRFRKLMNEVASVNPDEQPNKWRRLQETCKLLVNDPTFDDVLPEVPNVDA